VTRRNVELKAHFPDLQAGHNAAARIGAIDTDTLKQVDTYFHSADGRLKLREITSRVSGESAELIWYARPDQVAARTSRFHVVPVPRPAPILDALEAGLGIQVVVRKTRRLYLWENVRIHLDEVDGLGNFLEFEAVLEEGQDEADGYAQLEQLQHEFGIDGEAVIGASYSDLLQQAD
jgi:adenylate cyclase class 2